MYFPYLYARQGECKSIEDLAGRLGSPQKVFPVLEPVVEDPRSLMHALDALAQFDEAAYVIINPSRWKLQQPAAVARWRGAVAGHLDKGKLVRPTLEIRPGMTLADVGTFLGSLPGRSVGLSIRSSQVAGAAIAGAAHAGPILHFLHSTADPSGYSAAIGAAGCVEVRDSFRAELRNADYAGQEPFTTAHLHYSSEGRPGFSDYTLLPGHFNPGGGPLGAAVIHVSFVSPADQSLWVEHFVSDETRQYQSSQPTKLMEAMTKLDRAANSAPGKFKASPGFVAYQDQFARRSPTSPTYNKRQQISHHIDTVVDVV